MTQAQAQALAEMQARNAALTPEERKARSAKAAAASRAAALARKKGAAATGGDPTQPKATATTAARAPAEPSLTFHAWRVCLRTDKGNVWVACTAPGMQRAGKLARKAYGGGQVLGVVREGVLPGTVTGA